MEYHHWATAQAEIQIWGEGCRWYWCLPWLPGNCIQMQTTEGMSHQKSVISMALCMYIFIQLHNLCLVWRNKSGFINLHANSNQPDLVVPQCTQHTFVCEITSSSSSCWDIKYKQPAVRQPCYVCFVQQRYKIWAINLKHYIGSLQESIGLWKYSIF